MVDLAIGEEEAGGDACPECSADEDLDVSIALGGMIARGWRHVAGAAEGIARLPDFALDGAQEGGADPLSLPDDTVSFVGMFLGDLLNDQREGRSPVPRIRRFAASGADPFAVRESVSAILAAWMANRWDDVALCVCDAVTDARFSPGAGEFAHGDEAAMDIDLPF
jgi:hypothetical protein